MEGALKDIIILFMIIAVYFLPYFLIFKLIKLSGGALGKIQGAVDGAGKWGRERGAIKSFKENASKSAAMNRKNKGLENVGKHTTTINDPDANFAKKGYARFMRSKTRSGLGTAGAVGAYGRQMAGQEREAALKNSKVQVAEDMRDNDLGYNDQLGYQQALAKGESEYAITEGVRAGTAIKIKSYGSYGRQAATEAIAASGKADRIRDIRASLVGDGVEGERIWNNAMESQAGSVVKVAADAVGKPFESLRAVEMMTQDAGTLRNMAAEYEESVRISRDVSLSNQVRQQASTKAQRLINIASEIRDNKDYYGSVNDEGKEFIRFVASGGSAGGQQVPPTITVDPQGNPAPTAVDFKGAKQTVTVNGRTVNNDSFTPELTMTHINQPTPPERLQPGQTPVNLPGINIPSRAQISTPPNTTALTADGTFYTTHPQPYVPNPSYDNSQPISDTNPANIPNPNAEWKETRK